MVWLGARSLWWFVRRVFYAEPFFKAYCAAYGKHLHTNIFLHWVQGKGDIIAGDNVTLDGKISFTFGTRFTDRPTLRIGSGTGISHNCTLVIGKAITIGSNCRIASDVYLFDSSGHPVDSQRRAAGDPPEVEDVRPVTIHDHVWIGRRAIVFPGVTIGEGCIVSAGSVVLTDIPPYTVVAGNPARRIGDARPRTEAASNSALPQK